MEQRSESRVKFNEPVMIRAVQNDDATWAGRFVDLSSNDMRIKSNGDLEVGSLLRLEVGDDLMMTEVRHCEPDGGEFSAGLLILSRLEKSELKRLLREAVAGPAPQRIPDDTALPVVA
jgi:PilZ domain